MKEPNLFSKNFIIVEKLNFVDGLKKRILQAKNLQDSCY